MIEGKHINHYTFIKGESHHSPQPVGPRSKMLLLSNLISAPFDDDRFVGESTPV